MAPVKSRRLCEPYFWIKYSLFVTNFLIWVGGICLVVLGAWSRVQKAFLNSVDIALMSDPALFLVAVGVTMFVISIFGCLGSFKEHVLLLKLFCVVIIVVYILQVIAGVMAFVFVDHVEQSILKYMTTAIKFYRTDTKRREILDYVQKRFECCGSSSYADWEYNEDFACSSSSQLQCGVPISCCIERSSVDCGLRSRRKGESYASQHVYTRGCTPILMSLYMDSLIILGTIAFAVAFLEIIAVILAHLLINIVVFSQLKLGANKEKKSPLHVLPKKPNNYPSTASNKDSEFTRL